MRDVERAEMTMVWYPDLLLSFSREGWSDDPEHPEPPENESVDPRQPFYVRFVMDRRLLDAARTDPEAAKRVVRMDVEGALAQLCAPDGDLARYTAKWLSQVIDIAHTKSGKMPGGVAAAVQMMKERP